MIDIVDYLLSYISVAKIFEDNPLKIITISEIEEKIKSLKGYLAMFLKKHSLSEIFRILKTG